MVEGDIISKTRKFLDEHSSLSNRLTQNEVGELGVWLQQELLLERQGWKFKLDGALQQIENHRKTAIQWETAFYNLKNEASGKSLKSSGVFLWFE